MRCTVRIFSFLVICVAAVGATAQSICPPRPAPGSPVLNPLDLYSQNGVLSVDLALKSESNPNGLTHYCYVYLNNGMPVEAPTLRLNPGDRIILNLTNNITTTQSARKFKSRHAPMEPMMMGDAHGADAQANPCLGGMVDATTTNMHFHGMNVPPTCHQDEVIKTILPNNGVPFQYSIQIPANDPPGMYWYHPHPHGFSAPQVVGGAAGALIIEGNDQLTQGLPERVLVIRQNPDAGNSDEGNLSLNFQPADFPRDPRAIIYMQPGQKEFWRVLNASTTGFVNLQVYYDTLQQLQLIALDGIPLQTPQVTNTILLPPAGRAEFIVPALPANGSGTFFNNGFNTGPTGDPNPPATLARILPSNDKALTVKVPAGHPAPPQTAVQRFSGLGSAKPTAQRSFYFSERSVGSGGPTQFFITVDGQVPRMFDPQAPPGVITKVGAVEDWTIENRSSEVHAFHIHQLHFLLMAVNGQPVPNPELLDTVTIPNWTGSGPFPSVTVRMDFRDPNIAGTFVYHCHILDHEDGGMMASIIVQP